MEGYGGLIELLLVAAFVLGWGVLELRGLRLDAKKAKDAEAAKAKRAHDDDRNDQRPIV